MDMHERILQALTEASQSLILPRFRNLKAADIHHKDPAGGMCFAVDDVVTIVDLEVEDFMTRRLTALLPGSLVLGEEMAAADPQSVAAALQDQGDVWVVDPLDGTANFKEGREEFCIMLALRHRGETVMAYIHYPLSGETLFAQKDKGAFLNGRSLPVVRERPLAESVGIVGPKIAGGA